MNKIHHQSESTEDMVIISPETATLVRKDVNPLLSWDNSVAAQTGLVGQGWIVNESKVKSKSAPLYLINLE